MNDHLPGQPSPAEGALSTSEPRWRVGIVGAGTMGGEIAAANLAAGVPVVLVLHDPSMLQTAATRVAGELTLWAAAPDAVRDALSLLHCSSDVASLAACDLVVESITEQASAKQELYRNLEDVLPDQTLLCSNTSSIPIATLSEGLLHKPRFCGLHFLHPVRRRAMVEVVAGPQTAAATLRAASAYSQSLGMWPLEVKDAPGFLVNRLLCMYLQAAMELLLEGVGIEAVDEAATNFGMETGPLQLCDEIGLDIVLSSGRVLWEAFPDRVRPSPLLIGLVKAGKLGCKTGEGFFRHTSAGAHSANAGPGSTAAALVDEWSTAPSSAAKNGLVNRLLLPMAREAQRVADEGIVPDRQTVDRAIVRSLGFPASHGGPLQWAATNCPRQ